MDHPSRVNPEVLEINATVFLVLDFLIAVTSVIANCIFMTTLVKRRMLHTPSNMLLGALCFNDLFVGIIVQPLSWTNIFIAKSHGKSNGKLGLALFSLLGISFGLSFTFVILISLDRYFAICHPYKYQAKATCKTHICISIVSGIFVTGIFCLELFIEKKSKSSASALTSYMTLVHYVMPFFLILFCYVKIYLVILKQRKDQITIEEIANDTQLQDLRKKKQEKDRARFIAIILACFFICYAPSVVWCILRRYCSTCCGAVLNIALPWVVFLFFTSSLLNPIIYYLRSTDIRKAAKRMIFPTQSVSQ
eukprot:Seg731.7 transcript_id=Seg731.7/GoldUCD/mRNA.D3Y31 product="Trace amine-associated receptor 1" protein_id=Seg731.7/GoldUCD/D3Y31